MKTKLRKWWLTRVKKRTLFYMDVGHYGCRYKNHIGNRIDLGGEEFKIIDMKKGLMTLDKM